MAQKNGDWESHKKVHKMRLFNEFMGDGEQTEICCHLKSGKENCPGRQLGGSQAVGANVWLS